MSSPLPSELEREIVEAVVRANYKNATVKLNLSLVAQRFHFWVDQVFYESVTIANHQEASKFLKLVDMKPAGFFATFVKALTIYNDSTNSETPASAILAVCTGVQLLKCWLWEVSILPAHLDQLLLRRLSMPLNLVVKSINTTEPAWLLTLTHLDVAVDVHEEDPDASSLADILRRLPRLTNLALHFWADRLHHAAATCTSFPRLRVLVIFTQIEDLAEHGALDPRIVLVPYTAAEHAETVQAARWGLPDFWTRAESIVDERRVGLGATAQPS
ncbi:hypothetical protein B0H16DRAFT_1550140 [Mycena metata]|uniref:Uncharacterized protein n=1 Tax=Mycena metata TaxID=1033252 RepID=A0AAD7N9F4_9AGAR|nr:hypothetical protein B0H16DRAFT_1550140 [Mycena metata]